MSKTDPIRVSKRGTMYELVDGARSVEPANQFLQALHLRGLSIMTMRAYAYDLVIFYRWLRGAGKELQQLVPADVLSFLASQREARAEPRSINRRLTTVRLLYRFLTDRELGVGPGISLPAAHYKGPGRDRDLGLHRLHRRIRRKFRVKEARKLVEPLNPDQVRVFLRSLARYRDVAIVHLMLLCGLRSREVLGIELSDVVFTHAQLRVRGKGNRERVLPLPDMLVRGIRQYLDFERPTRCSTSRLFVVLQGKRRGEPMTTAGLRSLFRHRRRRRTMALANPHRFRHTFGTDMARAGVRLPILQKLMGHADMKTTLQYIELSLADVADEYRRVMTAIDKRYRRR